MELFGDVSGVREYYHGMLFFLSESNTRGLYGEREMADTPSLIRWVSTPLPGQHLSSVKR